MHQLGIDYASVDGNHTPDFNRAREAGIVFAYIRRSYCYYDVVHRAFRTAHDQTYDRDAATARKAGLVVGAYLAPSFHRDAPSPAEQVANFWTAPGDFLDQDLPTALDVEFVGAGVRDTGLSEREVFNLVLEYVAELKKYRPTVAVYTSHVQWHDDNGLRGPDDPRLNVTVLWQKTPYPKAQGSHYVPGLQWREPHAGTIQGDPHDYWRVPLPWERNRPWLQQGEGDVLGVPGFSSTVDLNRFYPLSASTVRPTDATRLAWLHRVLNFHGLWVPEQTNGMWVKTTEDAVREFQRERGLVVDGVVGVRTYAALCS